MLVSGAALSEGTVAVNLWIAEPETITSDEDQNS